MNARLLEIRRRQAMLVVQSAAQRNELGRCLRPWLTPIAFADRGIALARRVATHPLALAIGIPLLLRLGRGHWGKWAGQLWMGWQICQSLQDRQSRKRG